MYAATIEKVKMLSNNNERYPFGVLEAGLTKEEWEDFFGSPKDNSNTYSREIPSLDEITEIVREAAVKYPIKKVELFGSYAYGEASDKSDIDLIITHKGRPTVETIGKFVYEVSERLNKPVDTVDSNIQESRSFIIGRRITVYETI